MSSPPLAAPATGAPAPDPPSEPEQAYLRLRQSVYEVAKDEDREPKPEMAKSPEPAEIHVYDQSEKADWLWRAGRAALDYLMREGHFWVAAGVLVLFLGASFLVRYTITMGWFSPGMRLISTFAVGLILTGIGLAVRHRRQSWALAVQGCGLGLMYLTVVGAVRVYELLGQSPALGLMSSLVVVTAILALWQNSQIVAHLGIVAAFAAPLLVSSSQNNYVGLFSYYSLLNVGILIMCQVRPWRRLYLTGFSLSFGIFGVWLAAWYRPPMFFDSAPFLALFYLFYAFIGLRTAAGDGLAQDEDHTAGGDLSLFPDDRLQPNRLAAEHCPIRGEDGGRRQRTDLTLTILAPVLFLSYVAVMSEWAYVLATAASVVGLLYLALALGLRGRYLPSLTARIILWQAVIYLNLGLALFLFDLDLPKEALSQWTILSLIWSLEGALLCYIGESRAKAEALVFGRLSLALAAIFSVGSLILRPSPLPSGILSQFFVTTLVLGGALLHAAWSQLKFAVFPTQDSPPQIRNELSAFRYLTIVVWTFGIVMEGSRLLGQSDAGFAFSWMLTFGSLLTLALLALGWKIPLLLASGSREPEVEKEPEGYCPLLIKAGMLVLIPLGWETLLALIEFLAPWDKHIRLSSGPPDAFALLAWLLTFLVQALAIKQARRYIPAGFWLTAWGLALALLGGRALFTLAQGWHFPAAWLEPIRLLPVLLGLTLIWRSIPRRLFQEPGLLNVLAAFLAGLSLWRFLALAADPAGAAGLLPYVPLLNAVDLVQAASCILPLMALHSLAGEDFPELRRNLIYALGILLFVWLNLALGRAVHHYAGVPYSAAALFGSNYFQAASALVWGLVGIGAMITGHRAGRRVQWLLGASLMALDLAKIFFIDLSKVGTVGRIISFVAVGLLLILVGYFAPLPPSENIEPEEEGKDEVPEETATGKA